MEAKINKWELSNVQAFAQQRKSFKKKTLKDNQWNEKKIENDVTHRGLISKIYKQLTQLSNNKNKQAN